MEVLTGKLKYKQVDFTFVFNKEELELIPDDSSISYTWTHKEIAKGVYTLADPIKMEENVLIGSNYETGNKIVFIMVKGSLFSQKNSIFFIKPLAYITFKANHDKIDRISFACPELDLIFPVSKAYDVKMSGQAIFDGTYSVESKAFTDLTTQKTTFVFRGKKIFSYFSVSRFIHAGNRSPLEYVSTLYFDFEETDDYLFVYELAPFACQVIQFLCNRQNIDFDSIKLSCPYKNGNHQQFAEMFLLIEMEKEDSTIIKKRFIPYACLAGNEGKIFQMISDDTLYLRHLPESYRQGRKIDVATFVMITAAFEWEFRQLYPDGIIKKEKTVAAEQRVADILDELINENTGDIKGILKYLRKQVGNDNLSGEIVHVGSSLGMIIDCFGKHLYEINGEILKYPEMGDRIAQQRNNYAHGNLDKELIGLALLDIMYLKMIVYAMQLKRAGVEDHNIRDAINSLFHMNLYFEKND